MKRLLRKNPVPAKDVEIKHKGLVYAEYTNDHYAMPDILKMKPARRGVIERLDLDLIGKKGGQLIDAGLKVLYKSKGAERISMRRGAGTFPERSERAGLSPASPSLGSSSSFRSSAADPAFDGLPGGPVAQQII